MKTDARSLVPGSELPAREGEHWLGPVQDFEPVSITVLLRRPTKPGTPTEDELLSGHYQPPSREAAAAALAATPSDMQAAESFAEKYGLKVASEDAASRRIRLRGTAAEANKAFGVQLGWAEDAEGHRYLTYRGAISVPQPLAGIVTGVLGLDLHTAARHH
jgi:kumamolisin